MSDGTGRRVPFRDGIVLPREFEDTEKAVEQARGELDLKAKIKKFVTKTVVAGQPLPKPGNGDCWACLMFDQEPPAGENQLMGWIRTPALDRSQSRDTDHLLQHIEEHYMHGSLIVNAFRAAGYRDEGIYIICYSGTPNYARVRSVVSTYLKRRLGLATR